MTKSGLKTAIYHLQILESHPLVDQMKQPKVRTIIETEYFLTCYRSNTLEQLKCQLVQVIVM